MPRPIYEVARDIRAAWKNVNYAAKPYLEAMGQLEGPDNMYYADDARSIVLYFLSNASGFRGGEAKKLKAELKQIINRKDSNGH